MAVSSSLAAPYDRDEVSCKMDGSLVTVVGSADVAGGQVVEVESREVVERR